MATPTFGLELLYNNYKQDIRGKIDAAVCFIHWKLISAGFLCIGLGEDVTVPPDSQKSESLPSGWHEGGESFSLRYLLEDDLYLMKIQKVNSTLLVNLLRVKDERVTSSAINLNSDLSEDLSSSQAAFPTASALSDRLQEGLLELMKTKQTRKEARKEKESKEDSKKVSNPDQDDPLRDPLRIDRRPYNPSFFSDPLSHNPMGGGGFLPPVGRGDLDPFDMDPGGMLMIPPRGLRQPGIPGNLPLGAVPPGARFDPFGPVLPPRGQGPRPGGLGIDPDPDHMRPPTGADDMFM
ncbi:unnamed protein product [Darwinula stevensoni]|uniref:Proteasome inhibitor PI31 subunit n=1 Tax=Darwinula stevensoni TaxID=69355 RepID=A0A7R8X6V5_9CRUS|nr:unnamed protein product [Darwinula stevensoni]CAG0888018.1 unnamed protein product [Darwinula stevensoni]